MGPSSSKAHKSGTSLPGPTKPILGRSLPGGIHYHRPAKFGLRSGSSEKPAPPLAGRNGRNRPGRDALLRPPRDAAWGPSLPARHPASSPALASSSTVDAARPRGRGRGRTRPPASAEASTTGLLATRQQGQEAESSGAGRRGCKVAPEPREWGDECPGGVPLPPMPGSPSFRFYCQKTAAVDKILAEADDKDGSVRVRGILLSFTLTRLGSPFSAAATTRQLSNRNEVTATKAHESNEVSEHKEGTRWLRFRGLSMVATAWHNLFSCRTSKTSRPAAAESHRPPAASRSHP